MISLKKILIFLNHYLIASYVFLSQSRSPISDVPKLWVAKRFCLTFNGVIEILAKNPIQGGPRQKKVWVPLLYRLTQKPW